MTSTREIVESALQQNLIDEKHNPVHLSLLPGLSPEDLDVLLHSLPVHAPNDVRELLQFCAGIDGLPLQIDFSGRTLRDGFQADFVPHGLPIAKDECGNHWIVDLQPGKTEWGPIYFCCHDAPVMLLQAASIRQFVDELFRMYMPPHRSLISDVHEDRLYDVSTKNPCMISHAAAIVSGDRDVQTFAASLGSNFEIIDLRNVPVGMGFSWGRYGPDTEVKRLGTEPIFAYRKVGMKKTLMSRLFGG